MKTIFILDENSARQDQLSQHLTALGFQVRSFSAAEFDSSSTLLGDCGGRGTVAIHIDNFSSVALVGWTRHQLRSEASARDWADDSRVRLFAFYAANGRGQLLDKFFSAGCGSRIRHGHQRGAAYHDGNGFSR